MFQPAATVDSYHSCPLYDGKTPHVGGTGKPNGGSPNVRIGGRAALRKGDPLHCHGSEDRVSGGSAKVKINGKPAARIFDPSQHGGQLISGGSTNVMMG